MPDSEHMEVLKAIREKLVNARRQAALDFENDATEAAYVFYQRHIDAADRAIADEEKLKPNPGWKGIL
jgi:hypothetical protein